MANNASYVSAGKPAIGGAVYRAEAGTTAPTNATSTIDTTKFSALGYCSEDGLVNSNSPSMTTIKAWGNDTVLVIQEEKTDTFQLTLLEVLNTDVLAAVYGEANVTGTLSTGVAINVNSTEPEYGVWVVDMIMNSGVAKRIVVPNGKISELGDITYSDSDAVGYAITITAIPDTSGNSHYEYLQEVGSE